MNKKDILNMDKNNSFKLGKEHKEMGFSIHYNPYRNFAIDKDNKIAELNNSYIDGYNS